MLVVDIVRSAWRSQRRRPAFAALTAIAFALALAINTAVYAVFDALVNPETHIEHPERLYFPVYHEAGTRLGQETGFVAALGGASSVESFASYDLDYHQAAARDRASRDVDVAVVAPNFFEVVRVTPVAGRVFNHRDLSAGGIPLVITDKIRSTLFRRDEDPIGAQLRIANYSGVVVGVVGGLTGLPPQGVDVWRPDASGRALAGAILRIKLGFSREEAFRELDVIRQRVARDRGVVAENSRLELVPAVGKPFRNSRFHLALVGAVVSVLLLVAVNISSLQSARSLNRTREWATRAALGASRATIIAQVVTEAALVAVVGLGLGLILAKWGMGVVRATIPQTLAEYLVTPQWSWRVFVATAGAVVTIVLVAGLVPAVRIVTTDLGDALRSSPGMGARRERTISDTLVVCQVTLALPLCIASALLGRAALALEGFDPGIDSRPLVAGRMIVPPGGHPREALLPGAERLLSRIRQLPGIVDAAAARGMAVASRGTITVTEMDGTRREITLGPTNRFTLVTPTFFRTLRLRMRQGRDFYENGEAQPALILNETAANQWWPQGNAVGRAVKLGSITSNAPWARVIGVHGTWRTSLREAQEPSANAYYSFGGDTANRQDGYLVIYARTSGDAAEAATRIRNLQAGGLGLPAARIEPYDRALGLDVSRQRQRFVTGLFIAFGTLGLVIAAFGAYAISAHAVAQRTREFGIRLALGATRRDIVTLVLRQGILLGLLGTAGGLVLTTWTASSLQAMLAGAAPLDALLFGGVSLVLLVAVALATLPAAIHAAAVEVALVLGSN